MIKIIKTKTKRISKSEINDFIDNYIKNKVKSFLVLDNYDEELIKKEQVTVDIKIRIYGINLLTLTICQQKITGIKFTKEAEELKHEFSESLDLIKKELIDKYMLKKIIIIKED